LARITFCVRISSISYGKYNLVSNKTGVGLIKLKKIKLMRFFMKNQCVTNYARLLHKVSWRYIRTLTRSTWYSYITTIWIKLATLSRNVVICDPAALQCLAKTKHVNHANVWPRCSVLPSYWRAAGPITDARFLLPTSGWNSVV